MKIMKLPLVVIACAVLAACVGPKKDSDARAAEKHEEKGLLLGFSQIGAESAWRKRHTLSVQEAAAGGGVQLLFSNAEQKQENQIKAIRSFIAYQVDVIAFVPIVSSGWDNVLREAREAGIPVLVTDRKIDIQDENLYAGYIGTDSIREGREAARYLLKKFNAASGTGAGDIGGGTTADAHETAAPDNEPIRIVELSGTIGSSAASGRARGFREVLADHPRFTIIYSESGDFLRSKGYELMRTILPIYADIDVIFSHNDGMTLGVLDAMREKELLPGKDIIIITVDAEQAAIDALNRGEVNCVIECNPKQGPQIIALARQLARGEPIPRLIHVEETVFTEGDDLSSLEPRGY
ncbi:MAG: ABC transporter substrate-binding protein [Treponema sp.]|jgi:simple sugar transport system substrate-binding protein|nr:ABC transporter substrate-binding protein [Treponema sp.]